MLTLSLFAACEKVLLDPIDDQLSLMGVCQNVYALGSVNHGQDATEEEREVIYGLPPITFASFWFAEQEDLGKKFKQQITIIAPDEKKTEIQDSVEFTVTRDFHRIAQKVDVTCRAEGEYRVSARLIEIDTEVTRSFEPISFRVLPPRTSQISVSVSKIPETVEA